MDHLSPNELSAALDGALEGAARARVEGHLAECETCRDALAALAALDRSLRPVLEHDPGDAYFETFPARVEDRIRAAGLRGAQSRLGGEGWLGWLSSPRSLAWVGAVAAVVGGAGIVMLTNAPQRSLIENTKLVERGQQEEARLEAEAPGTEPRKQTANLQPAPAALGGRAQKKLAADSRQRES